MSPTARTLRWFRERGMPCAVVERWIPGANVRQDLFGLFDLVVIGVRLDDLKVARIIGVQVCADDGGAMAARRQKILRNLLVPKWLEAGGLIWIFGWGHRSARRKDGSKSARKIWTQRIIDLDLRTWMGGK